MLSTRSLCCLLFIFLLARPAGAFKVLVFTETQGFHHNSIDDGVEVIQALGVDHGFDVDVSADSSPFTAETLAQYAAVVWLNTTGDVLNAAEQSAFEAYVQSGGGYVGVHAAADCEYDWPWYGQLLGNGAWFDSHPSIQGATLTVEDATHAATAHLSSPWAFTDEWYNFQASPSAVVDVLLTIDETSYEGGTMGADHPISWHHAFDGGRVFYTAMGHRGLTFDNADFKQHLLGGIVWAASGGGGGDGTCTTDGECDDDDECTTDICFLGECVNNAYDLDGDGITTFPGDIGELVGCLMITAALDRDGLDSCCSAGNCICRIDRNADGVVSILSDLPSWALCIFTDSCESSPR